MRLERLSAFILFEDWTSGSWKEMVINANMTPGFYAPPVWQARHHFHHPGEFKDSRAWPGETSTPSDSGIFQCMKPLHLSKRNQLCFLPYETFHYFSLPGDSTSEEKSLARQQNGWDTKMRRTQSRDLKSWRWGSARRKADTLLDHSLGDAQDAHLSVVPSKVPIIRPTKPW